ncbi:hypothetical protein WJX73_005871 [Symbiochloris irregularis]|uniref:Uncharacterized protein n=1 Tax=Symbiochloris irregularis TaxID=706552 RepID=A0AAW1PUU3_9CHLO
MSNVYDYAGGTEADPAELRSVGKAMQQSSLPKDSLIKLLKHAGALLEAAPQSEESRTSALDVCKAVVQKSILHHKDKGVKVFAAYCLSNIVRLWAGEADLPYELRQLQDIFVLFIYVFRLLETPSSPLFTRCLSIFELVAQVKCLVLMLDCDDEEAVVDLFQVLCEAINANNQEQIRGPAIEIMAAILEEQDGDPNQLLDMVLNYLVPPASEDHPEACDMVRRLLQRIEREIQPKLQVFLMGIIEGTVDSDLKPDFHTLVYQLYKVLPQVLLPVLPRLGAEMSHPEEDSRRVAAVHLMGRLFSLPASDMAVQNPHLLEALLVRCRDQKVAVRLATVQACADLLHNLASTEAPRQQVEQAVTDRLLDFDDKVRSAACIALGTAAAADLECVSQAALEAVSMRMRDTKLAVRKDAAAQLLAVYRAHCKGSSGEATSASSIAWIPARVVVWTLDKAIGQHAMDTLLRPGLLPAKQEPSDAARQWVALFQAANPKERAALMERLAGRHKLQGAVQRWLALRTHKEPPQQKERDGIISHIARTYFADDLRAREHLLKLAEHKDNNVFKGLAELAASDLELAAAAPLIKSLVQKVGLRGATADVARSLAVQLTPTLLSPSCLQAVLQLALDAQNADSDIHDTALQLLNAVAYAAPSLFVNAAEQVVQMLESGDSAEAHAATQVLAAAASFMQLFKDGAEGRADAVKTVTRLLTQSMDNGPYKTTKAAVRALVKVLSPGEATTLLNRQCQQLMDRVSAGRALSQPHLAAFIQVLSSVGQLRPDIFAPHAPEFVDFVLRTLLPCDASALAKGRQSRQKDLPAGEAVARACTPDPASLPNNATDPAGGLKEVVEDVCGEIMALLESEDMEALGCADASEAGILRMALASALLRICRRHDGALPADAFMQLSLTMQDQSRGVRNSFAYKVHRTVAAISQEQHCNQKAAKFAAMLPLAGADPNQQNQQAAFSYLRAYVGSRRRDNQHKAAARAASAQEAGGAMLHEYPEFLLPFLMQILAHHTDFPEPEDAAIDPDEVYRPFLGMLQFALEALLLPSAAGLDAPGATLPAITKFLTTLKRTEDATPNPSTQNLHTVCDLGLKLAPAVLATFAPEAETGGSFPGTVPLPTNFFRRRTDDDPGTSSVLPRDFEAEVQPAFHDKGKPGSAPSRQKKGNKETPSKQRRGRGGSKSPISKRAAADPPALRQTGSAAKHKAQKRSPTASPASSSSHPEHHTVSGLRAPPEDEVIDDADVVGDADSPMKQSARPRSAATPPVANSDAIAPQHKSAHASLRASSEPSEALEPPHAAAEPVEAVLHACADVDQTPGLDSNNPSPKDSSPDENNPAGLNRPRSSKRAALKGDSSPMPSAKKASSHSHRRQQQRQQDDDELKQPQARKRGRGSSHGTASEPGKEVSNSRGRSKSAGRKPANKAGSSGKRKSGGALKTGDIAAERAPSRAQPRRGAKDVAVANIRTGGKPRNSIGSSPYSPPVSEDDTS